MHEERRVQATTRLPLRLLPVLQAGANSMIDKIITTGFKAIHLIYFFTAGADEVGRPRFFISTCDSIQLPGSYLQGCIPIPGLAGHPVSAGAACCPHSCARPSDPTCAQVKCWQIRKATKAPQAAGTIHTDFERGFICAEVGRRMIAKTCNTCQPGAAMLLLRSFRL